MRFTRPTSSQTVLITQSLLESVAAATTTERIGAVDVLNVFTFIEAVVLYDKLGYLAAEGQHLYKSLRSTFLIPELVRHDLVEPIDVAPHEQDYIEADVLRAISTLTKEPRQIQRLYSFASLSSPREPEWQRRPGDPAWHIGPYSQRPPRGVLETLVRHPREDHTTYLTRAFQYWSIANSRQLAFYPDYGRSGLLREYLKREHKSLADEAYRRIAEALAADVEELRRAGNRHVIPMPPLAALVLNKCNGDRSKLLDALLGVRQEFSATRTALTDVDNHIRAARSIKDGQQWSQKRTQILSELAKKAQQPDETIFDQGLDFLSKLIGVVVTPMNPAAYADLIESIPLEWIRQQWGRRPVAQLLSLRRKVSNQSNLDTLVFGLFGVDLHDETLNHMVRLNSGQRGGLTRLPQNRT
jgi:hypothetical protein